MINPVIDNSNTTFDTQVVIQTFSELTTHELYAILKARASVFIVEQECPYQDLDEIDFRATHITLLSHGEIVAYSRVYQSEHPDLWHIGRVMTTQRNKHYGIRIMKEAIQVARNLGVHHVEIDAQSYAIGFYEKVGFQVCSDEFLLDGILHKKMELYLE